MNKLPVLCAVMALGVGLAGCAKITGALRGGGAPPPAKSFSVVRTYEKPVPALPPPGKVRIVAKKLREDAHVVSWQWTVMGERNWLLSTSLWKPERGRGVTLGKSALLNKTEGEYARHNAYEFVVTVRARPSSSGKNVTAFDMLTAERQIAARLSGAITGVMGGADSSHTGMVGPVRGRGVAATKVCRVRWREGEQVMTLPVDAPLFDLEYVTARGARIRSPHRLKIEK